MARFPIGVGLDSAEPTTQSSHETQEPRAAIVQQAPDESHLSKFQRRAAQVVATSSSSFSTSPVTWSSSSVGGPTPPDVRGAPRRVVLPPIQSKTPTGRRMEVVDGKVNAAITAMKGQPHLPHASIDTPETTQSWVDLDACRASIERMFGVSAAALAQRVFEAVPQDQDARYAFEPPLILATALHSVCAGNRQQAEALLNAVQLAPARPPAPLRAKLAALHRVLAATGAGMEVLCHVEGVSAPQQKEAFHDAMRISMAMADKGLDPGGPSLLSDLVLAVDTPAARATWLHRSIGTDQDTPPQLLTQALLYAHGKLHPTGLSNPQYKSAYVAWKKGKFTESGSGTEFNKTIERLNKVQQYGERGDHGPRTAANLAREAAHVLPKSIGHYKSPMSQMRHGAMGGDRTMLDLEAAKFGAALKQASDPLLNHLKAQANDPQVQQDLARLSIVAARIATLEQWQSHGRKNVAVDLRDVLARADRLHAELGRPGGARLDERVMLKELKAPAKLRKDGAPGPSLDGPSMMLHLQVLKDWGAQALREGTASAAASAELQQVPQRVKLARSIARGREASNPLFEWRDVLNIVTRKTARQGPSLAQARRVALQVAQGRYESMTHFTDGGGGGINVHAILGLRAGHGAAVVPALRVETARMANLTIGLSLTGGRFFVGTQNNKSVAAGVTGAFGVPLLPVGNSVGAGFIEASVGHDWQDGEGACITTLSDRSGWEQSGVDVVNFMFDHAGQAPKTPRAFWESFVERFGDDPNVAVNWNTEQASATTGVLGIGATVRGDIGHGMTLGPAVSADLSYTRERSGRDIRSDGADVPFQARASRWTLSGRASAVQATPKSAFGESGVSGLLNTVPLVGVGAEKVVSATGGVFRLGRTADGLLSPSLCQLERQFRNPERLLEFIEEHRPTLEAAMEGMQAESMSAQELLPRNRLNLFKSQVNNIPPQGNHTFGAFMTLKPEVARQIDAAEARLHTLQGKGDATATRRVLGVADLIECGRLMHEIDRLPRQDKSWHPISLYGVESNIKRSGMGIDFIVKAGSQGEAGANRLTALLVMGKPDLSVA